MVDVNGHGTRCASVAAGANIGVAQGATVESIRVAGSDGLAAADDVLAGLYFELWNCELFHTEYISVEGWLFKCPHIKNMTNIR